MSSADRGNTQYTRFDNDGHELTNMGTGAVRGRRRGLIKLPRKDYESLDYDVCYNKPCASMLESKDKMSLKGQEIVRWTVTFVIGVLTGLVAVFIDYFVKLLSKWKFDTVESSILNCNPQGCLIISLLIFILFNGGFSMIAGLLTSIEPVAAGSGIPEIKCYLNGIKVPHVVRLKTLLCKAVGVLFSVSGGLFVGKEGPMIHSGAIIGAGVPQFQSIALKKINFDFPYFRTDRDKRDFVSGGAAAGVAAAFGAPIGGVLFSLEEGCSFWNQALTWRTFFCSMSATFTLNLFLSGISKEGSGWGAFYQPGLINFGVFQCNDKHCDLWTAQDLGIFVIMGLIGGLLGAWFNALNTSLTRHRILHVQSKHAIVKVFEAILIAMITTTIAFVAVVFLGQCKTLPANSIQGNDTRNYFCNPGEYNDIATLFFNSQEAAIKQLFHLDGAFSLPSLGIFFICFYFLACWTYGAGIPSGLFVPCLLCGAAYGRFVATLLDYAGYTQIYHGTFALIGAASFLGGVVRMTISLTVILIESTNDISYGLPIMITLMVAKWSGDLFNKGLYDIHIDLKSVPLLEWSAPQETYSLRAKHIMESCLSYIYPHTRVQSLVGILRTTAHNAFPVVTVDKYQGNMLSEEDYEGNPVTCNEIYARSRGMTNVISEQKSKSRKNKCTAFDSNRLTSGSPTRNLLLSSSAVNMQSQRANQNAPNIYSSSMPASMMHDGFQQTDFENENNTSEDNVTETSPSQNLPLQEDEDVDISQSLTFHGVILRSQLVTLVQKQAYYREEEESYCQQILSFPEMTCFYPRYPDIHDLDLREISYESIMDVTPYMNPCPYMVSPDTPVPQVFNLFRTMGLRHLVVVNSKGQITGMITRHNLTHEYLHHVLKLQESGDLIN